MLLKFYARKDQLVNARPGDVLPINQPVPRVGRVMDDKGRYLASPEPFECDDLSPVGRRCIAAMRRGRKDPPLWAADEATATACGVPFVSVELVDGEWIEKRPAAAAKPTTKPAKSPD